MASGLDSRVSWWAVVVHKLTSADLAIMTGCQDGCTCTLPRVCRTFFIFYFLFFIFYFILFLSKKKQNYKCQLACRENFSMQMLEGGMVVMSMVGMQMGTCETRTCGFGCYY
ncbi:hypothetical protein AA313_de0209436 [Arthrobotrys entomopaga]|nr:hypothetical protein AA313_de0209436 [Arthrobotrys entomopaga]